MKHLQYALAYLFAVVWTALWGTWNWWFYDRWNFMWGRRYSPEPVRCIECGWAGPRRWTNHTYHDAGLMREEVEPADECPSCGAEI